MKTVILIAGIFAVIAGLIWAAQGAGYFPYPRSSFMVNESRWIYIGLVTAAGGLAAILLSQRV